MTIIIQENTSKLVINEGLSNVVVTPTNYKIDIQSVGAQGSKGDTGGVEAFIHTQSSPSSTWTINHNLGYKPIIQIFSVGGVELTGGINHTSLNQAIISFATAIAGTARCI
jgi:hypothetical protein